MAGSGPRTEKKYSIPRNKAVPDTPLWEIITSGSLLKSPTGSTRGYPLPLLRAAPGASTFTQDKRGVLYYFQRGRFFAYDESKSYTSFALETASIGASFFILPGVAEMAGWASKIVEKGGEIALETLTEKAKEGKHHAHVTLGDQIKKMESTGMVVLPGVNIVEVEHQSEPGGFMSKEQHRLILTYQGLDGAATRYQFGAPMKGDKAASTATQIGMLLNERMWAEVGYFTEKIKAEVVGDFTATQAEMQADFEKRFGEGSAVTNPKFADEVNARYAAELERKGFSPVASAERMLELFAPVAESYEGVPGLSVIMPNLRAIAAGRTS